MNELQHAEPVWRHRADFIIGAKIKDKQYSKDFDTEQLWTRRLDDGTCELCCVPFALYDLFLGDIVEVDDGLELTRVIRRSGHYGFRIATNTVQDQDAIAEQLHHIGCLTERFSSHLLAVDADDESSAQQVASLLSEAEKKGHIVQYETIKR